MLLFIFSMQFVHLMKIASIKYCGSVITLMTRLTKIIDIDNINIATLDENCAFRSIHHHIDIKYLTMIIETNR